MVYSPSVYQEIRSTFVCFCGSERLMEVSVLGLPSEQALTMFVRETLCHRDRLDPSQTPMFRTMLKRAGKLCGAMFHVEGPRLLKNSALWSAEENRILFYDSSGVRFLEVHLSESPDVHSIRSKKTE